MTSEFNARSFDRPRARAAPHSLSGHWSGGAPEVVELSRVTLVVAIKARCDACKEFINSDLDDLAVPTLVISAEDDVLSEWGDARQPVFVSPDAFHLLDVRWPPLYVLIDPIARQVLSEGVLFSLGQVAAEIAPYLDV